MFYVGIDVASDKHDFSIVDGKGKIVVANATFANDCDGFEFLLSSIRKQCKCFENVKIGLEATGHYSNNLLAFLCKKGFVVKVYNPLQVNLARKGQTLRKLKTDKADAQAIAKMLFAGNDEAYAPPREEIAELKALTRHRSRMVRMRAKLKISVKRLVTILFPELNSAFDSVHQVSCYAMMLEFPTIKAVSECHLTKLSNLLTKSSRGRFGREKAEEIKALARKSIGTNSVSVGFELQQTIRIIQNLQEEIKMLENLIEGVMDKINSPILTIPGISYTLGSVIISEIGDIHNFATPAKLLAFAGLEPSSYQSGKFTAGNTPMVKRGSTYLRFALLSAARLVSKNDETFKAYADKKRSENKHYFVIMSHVGKKLVRVIHHLLTTDTAFKTPAV